MNGNEFFFLFSRFLSPSRFFFIYRSFEESVHEKEFFAVYKFIGIFLFVFFNFLIPFSHWNLVIGGQNNFTPILWLLHCLYLQLYLLVHMLGLFVFCTVLLNVRQCKSLNLISHLYFEWGVLFFCVCWLLALLHQYSLFHRLIFDMKRSQISVLFISLQMVLFPKFSGFPFYRLSILLPSVGDGLLLEYFSFCWWSLWIVSCFLNFSDFLLAPESLGQTYILSVWDFKHRALATRDHMPFVHLDILLG